MDWRPAIGDPTLLGWLTVAAYLGAAWLCVGAARTSQPGGIDDERLVWAWRALALLMLLLAINKQLDLQSLLTAIAKNIAQRDGWYTERRSVQLWFIRGVVSASCVALLLGVWWMRSHLRDLWLACVGAAFMITFVLVRASSFHHVDTFLANGPGGLRMNWVLELGGIGCVALAAGNHLRKGRDR